MSNSNMHFKRLIGPTEAADRRRRQVADRLPLGIRHYFHVMKTDDGSNTASERFSYGFFSGEAARDEFQSATRGQGRPFRSFLGRQHPGRESLPCWPGHDSGHSFQLDDIQSDSCDHGAVRCREWADAYAACGGNVFRVFRGLSDQCLCLPDNRCCHRN